MLASYAFTLLQSVACAGILASMTLVGPTAGWATAASVLACAGGLALLLALQFPYAFHRVFDAVFVRFTGTGMPARVERAPLNRGLAWVVGAWFLGGAATWLLAAPLGAAATDVPFVVGASALAWVVGLLVVIVPAGAGVRELVLALTLGQLIGPAQALTIAVLTRFLQIIVDLLLGAAAGLLHYGRLKREAC